MFVDVHVGAHVIHTVNPHFPQLAENAELLTEALRLTVVVSAFTIPPAILKTDSLTKYMPISLLC